MSATATAPLVKIDAKTVLPPAELRPLLSSKIDAIRDALPARLKDSAPRQVVALVSAAQANPELAKCTALSLLTSLLKLAQLGLELGPPTNHAYLIPRRSGGITEATFQLGYPGLVELVYRSGQVAKVYAEAVRRGDAFEVYGGTDARIEHKFGTARGEVTAVYGVLKLRSGEQVFRVMTLEEVDDHRRRFSQFGKDGQGNRAGVWRDHFEEMARKTALIKVCKLAPKSVELPFLPELDGDGVIVTQPEPGALPAGPAPAAEDESGRPAEDEDGPTVEECVRDGRFLDRLLVIKGQSWGRVVAWVNKKFGTDHTPTTRWSAIDEAHRRAAVEALLEFADA